MKEVSDHFTRRHDDSTVSTVLESYPDLADVPEGVEQGSTMVWFQTLDISSFITERIDELPEPRLATLCHQCNSWQHNLTRHCKRAHSNSTPPTDADALVKHQCQFLKFSNYHKYFKVTIPTSTSSLVAASTRLDAAVRPVVLTDNSTHEPNPWVEETPFPKLFRGHDLGRARQATLMTGRHPQLGRLIEWLTEIVLAGNDRLKEMKDSVLVQEVNRRSLSTAPTTDLRQIAPATIRRYINTWQQLLTIIANSKSDEFAQATPLKGLDDATHGTLITILEQIPQLSRVEDVKAILLPFLVGILKYQLKESMLDSPIINAFGILAIHKTDS